MILEVKDLKTAYYVLGNPENKNKYDNRTPKLIKFLIPNE